MLKVAVITRHWIANYGSFLQTFATQWVIESLGYACEVIDYVRKDESLFLLERTLLQGKPNWAKPLPKRIAYLIARQPESVISRLVFKRELESNIHLSKRYDSFGLLEKDPPIADVYVTGSDQVWGPTASGEYDPTYLLAFAPEGARKVAFAASFGKGDLSNKAEELFRKELSHYDAIAVREDSAQARIRSFGLDAEQVVDPTLLWDARRWSEFASAPSASKFVLVYQIHNDSRVIDCAKEVACMLNLPLVRVSAVLHQLLWGGKFRYLPTPAEFIGLIRDAACVVTDSFHGTAFAITFNTPFYEVFPRNGTSERNESLLRLVGLEDRAVRSRKDVNKISAEVDFSIANKRLEESRIRSIGVFREMIDG